MGRVLWRTVMDDRVLEVMLSDQADIDGVPGADLFELGPVQVRRELAGVEEVLGAAATVTEAMETWDELREVGDDVQCTWAGDPEWVVEFLAGRFRLAPPAGWADVPSKFSGVQINGEWFDFDLQDLPWEEIASLGTDYGWFSLDYVDGWFRESTADTEDKYWWAGTEPDFEGAGWGLVLNPPMWPSGNSIDFRLSFVSDPTEPDIIEKFVWPFMTEMFSHITVNGATIYHREDEFDYRSSSNQDGPDAAPGSNPASSIPDPWTERADALSRDLHEAVTGAAPPDEVDEIRADLAAELLRTGYAEDAIEPLEQAVQSTAERLGADDVGVLDLQGMLGRALTEASRFDEAERVLHSVVDGRTRRLGPDDPQTLVARGNLLRAIGRGGRPIEALPMADALLADRQRLFGLDHPSTLDTRGHRAQLLSEAGRDADAIVEMEHLLTDRIRVLGPNHPDVASTRHNLAAVRSRSERSDPEASWWELQQNAVAVSDDLGPDHPDTLVAWGLVAEQLQRLGRDSEAVALLARLVEARSWVLGPDAAQTLVSRRMLCASQRRLGDVRQALAGVEDLESTALEVLGPTSPLLQQIRIERIACLRALLDEGAPPDPSIAARLEALIDQVVEFDLDSEGVDALLSATVEDSDEPPSEVT